MKKNTADKILGFALPLITVICIIVIWAVTAKAVGSSIVLPSVSETFSALFRVLSESEFYISLLGTIGRTAIAFLLSFALAFLLAYFSVKSDKAKKAIFPIIAITRALPTVAVVLLLLFWTNSRIAPVAVTSLVVFPTLYISAKESFSAVDKDQIIMCKAFGVSEKDVFFKVRLPQILPPVIRAAGSGISLNLKLMVAAEVLAATANSLGYMLNFAKAYFETARMIALVVITVVLGLITEIIFSRLARAKEVFK